MTESEWNASDDPQLMLEALCPLVPTLHPHGDRGHLPLPKDSGAAQAALLREIVGNPFRPVAPLWRTIKGGPRYSYGGHTYLGEDPDIKIPVSPWLTHADGRVLKMARAIYDARSWGEMPILADALEEAGCREEVILRHLRGEEQQWELLPRGEPSQGKEWVFIGWQPLRGPHVRGCWVLDLLLELE